MPLRRWCCGIVLGLMALTFSGCSLAFPLSLLTLLVRNDSAPDANAVLLSQPKQPARPALRPPEDVELPDKEPGESTSS